MTLSCRELRDRGSWRLLLWPFAVLAAVSALLAPASAVQAQGSDETVAAFTTTYKDVSAGGRHSCGLSTSGTITCWGNDDDGQVNAPSGSFKAVSVGEEHSCGLSTSGTITCWGYNDDGQSNEPSGSFKAVSAGNYHICGLSTSGTITCWGWNSNGQADAPSGSFKAVSAGLRHSCGLSTSGTITCWGYNNSGQVDAPSGSFKAVSAGNFHTCGLSTSGTITCWGYNGEGRTDAPSGSFKAVAAGRQHSCGLSTSGTITCWGYNNNGQVDAPSGSFKAVSAGGQHSCGLSTSGTITCWGSNVHGQSNPLSGATSVSVPGKVGRPSVTAGDGTLRVSWTAPDDGGSAIIGYYVGYGERGSTSSGAIRLGVTTSWTITGLTNGVVYSVGVQAFNSAGKGPYSDSVSATPVASASRPDPVRQISGTPGDSSLAVAWTAPSDGGSPITGYEVSYIESEYVGCGDCGVVAEVITTTSLRATISGLTNGTSYTVYVRARNSVGVGLWVTSASGTPVASASVPGRVGRPSVSVGDGSLTVSWSAPSDGGAAITSYEVWYSTSSQSRTRTTSSTSVTLTGLANGTSYAVYVRAQNSQGFGSWSDAASGTPVASATRPSIVGQPSVSVGDGSLTVSWSAPSNGGSAITGYDVRYIETSYVGCGDCGVAPTTTSTTSRRVTITGLTNGTSYTVSVRAKNSVGAGLWSFNASGTPAAAATVPGKVGRPLVSVGDGSLTVSWSAPSNGGSAITGYDVRARSQDGTHELTRGTSASTSVTVTGLTNGKSYNVSVRARNSVGSGSWSDSASGTPVAAAAVPGKPARPSVTAGDGSLTVSWSAPSNGGSAITGYEVWYSPDTSSQSWTRSTTATSITVTGLTNGTSHTVHVRAQNPQGLGVWSDAASGTPVGAATVPGKVGRPSLIAGDRSLTVSWFAPNDGGAAITDYDVRYIESFYIGCGDCGVLPWVNWQSSTVSAWRSTTITGLTNGTSYAVVVRAKNSVGAGAWSDDEWATPVAAGSVPAGPAQPAVTAADGSLTVSWSAPSDGGSAITGYDVWYGPQGGTGQYWAEGTTATSTTITGLTNGTSYGVFVRAKNSVGAGAWSDGVWATPTSGASVPDKPARPSVVAGDGSLAVSWSPPANGGSEITGYEIWYRPSTSSSYTTLNTTATSITISGLTNGTGYTVFVRAQNAEGSGEWSDAVSGTPMSGTSVPGKPALPSVAAGDRSLTVSWSPPAEGGSAITGYEVWYSPNGSNRSWTHRTTATGATISNLTNGTSYAVHVRAQNSEGLGEWSERASGTPVAAASAPSDPILTLSQNNETITLLWYVEDNGGAPIVDYHVSYRVSSDNDPHFRQHSGLFRNIDAEKCFYMGTYETRSRLTQRPESGTVLIRLDADVDNCYFANSDLRLRTLEMRVEATNAAGLRSRPRSKQLAVIPWHAPSGSPTIADLTVERPRPHDVLLWWSSLDVYVRFVPVNLASHYEVQWKIDGGEVNQLIVHKDDVGQYVLAHNTLLLSITVPNVWKDDRQLAFRVIAHNRVGTSEGEWVPLTARLVDVQAHIGSRCSSFDNSEIVSTDMTQILVVIGRLVLTFVGPGKISVVLRAVQGVHWTLKAVGLMDKLDRCYSSLGDFVSELPIISDIVSGYEHALGLHCVTGSLDPEHYYSCLGFPER